MGVEGAENEIVAIVENEGDGSELNETVPTEEDEGDGSELNETVAIVEYEEDESELKETVAIVEYVGVDTALTEFEFTVERVGIPEMDEWGDVETLIELDIVLILVTLDDELTDVDPERENSEVGEVSADRLTVTVVEDEPDALSEGDTVVLVESDANVVNDEV